MEHLIIDSEDFEDLLFQIEDSFQVKFDLEDIQNNLSINEIIGVVVSKMNLKEGIECSNQITFFRLRDQISKKHKLDSSQIGLETKLKEIFPYKDRRKKWNKTFEGTDFKVPNLRPPIGLYLPAILITIISFFFIFGKNWNYGLPIFLVSATIVYLCSRYGKALPARSLRDLTKHIVKFDYRGTRNRVGTFNHNEIKQIIFGLFIDWLNKEDSQSLSFETKINYLGRS